MVEFLNRSGQKSFLDGLKYWFIDLIVMMATYFLSYFVYRWIFYPESVLPISNVYRITALIIIILHSFTFILLGDHFNIISNGYWKQFVAVCKHCFIVYAVLIVMLFAIQQSEKISRGTICLFAVLNILLMYLERIIVSKIVKKYFKNVNNSKSVLLVTTAELAETILHNINQNPEVHCCGIADFGGNNIGSIIGGVKVVADKNSAEEYICSHWVDEVFVAIPNHISISESFFSNCYKMGVTTDLVLQRMDGFAYPIRYIRKLGGYSVITGTFNRQKPTQLIFKRIIDIIGSIFGLIFTAIFTIIFAPIIYIQSPGPIFFAQKRVGKNGKIFTIYKLRSMYMDAEERKNELMKQNKMDGLMFKMDDDPRIIPIGKFIRKFSIDEFPQFWNVLIGQMSLVGTRPPTVDEYEQYSYHHKARLAMKPGITGMWQVSGRSDITDFEEIVRLDRDYIEDWNIGKDFKILFKTVAAVFMAKGSE